MVLLVVECHLGMVEAMVSMKSLTLTADEALLQSVAILMPHHLMNAEATNQLMEIATVALVIVIVVLCHRWEVLHTTDVLLHLQSILQQELA